MTETHPAMAVLEELDLSDLAASAHLFAENAVWHYSNPNLPELEGDHVGAGGIGAFFAALAEKSHGTFRIEPVSATPVGPELVVVQSRNTLTLETRFVTVDVVVVWRIVAGRIEEVWDIVPGQPTEVHDARH
ncbi:MAG: nuclear transport factor 2 family protein [Paracoccaceae bacterium]|nr:nuclear transport factor 2 family protein [Paracoccaceae bacterium]